MERNTVPMANEDFQRVLSVIEDWGIQTKWQDIDETLYGRRREKSARGMRGKIP
jgi:hypothetical protein